VNPAHPQDRIIFQTHDAAAKCVITQKKYGQFFKDISRICADQNWDELSSESTENPDQPPNMEDMAYIIYTSGTTGLPKGVVTPHAGLANICHACDEVYHLREKTGVHLQMASNTFDVFIEDVIRSLCTGAKLVIVPTETILEPERLYALMRETHIDSAAFVPAVIREMMKYLHETGQDLSFMNLIIVGADKWTVGEYRELHQLCGEKTRVVNAYGLTEVSIDNTFFDGSTEGIEEDRIVPIGKPFPNTRLVVLDRNLQPAPAGVPGELYIGGSGLADSYLNQPDLTEERFVELSVFDQVKERYFKTGDQVRYLPDGNIELLGRLDNQVKIRGFRIEINEIEAVLRQHPAVNQAAVCLQSRSSGDQYLAAYIVPQDGSISEADELRNYCRQKLPDYMMPSAFENLDKLPLTPNGKIDYRSLPEPSSNTLIAATELVTPCSATEKVIADIWKSVLELDQVGVNDIFFDLGGHSLLATQVVSRIRQALHIDLPLRVFFEAMTIAGLAAYIDKSQQLRDSLTSERLDASGNREEFTI